MELSLPEEVAHSVENKRRHYGPRFLGVRYYAKLAWSKGAAWDDAVRSVNGITDHTNPFRKAHTDNFWVYIKVELSK